MREGPKGSDNKEMKKLHGVSQDTNAQEPTAGKLKVNHVSMETNQRGSGITLLTFDLLTPVCVNLSILFLAGRRRRGVKLRIGGATISKGRGGSRKVVPTKKQLDAELDDYMSMSRSRLDKQLDDYMSTSRSRLDAELDEYMSMAGQPQPLWD